MSETKAKTKVRAVAASDLGLTGDESPEEITEAIKKFIEKEESGSAEDRLEGNRKLLTEFLVYVSYRLIDSGIISRTKENSYKLNILAQLINNIYRVCSDSQIGQECADKFMSCGIIGRNDELRNTGLLLGAYFENIYKIKNGCQSSDLAAITNSELIYFSERIENFLSKYSRTSKDGKCDIGHIVFSCFFQPVLNFLKKEDGIDGMVWSNTRELIIGMSTDLSERIGEKCLSIWCNKDNIKDFSPDNLIHELNQDGLAAIRSCVSQCLEDLSDELAVFTNNNSAEIIENFTNKAVNEISRFGTLPTSHAVHRSTLARIQNIQHDVIDVFGSTESMFDFLAENLVSFLKIQGIDGSMSEFTENPIGDAIEEFVQIISKNFLEFAQQSVGNFDISINTNAVIADLESMKRLRSNFVEKCEKEFKRFELKGD